MTENTTADAAEAPRADEYWVYAGRRHNGKVEIDAWVADPDGEGAELWYAAETKGLPPMLGAQYRVSVSREGERVFIHGRPLFEEADVVPAGRKLEWSARDGAARARVASDRAQRRAERNGADPVAEALEPLKAVAAKLRARADRDAFLARVIREISSSW